MLAMNTLTERIRTAREQAGLSQADVAKALRLSAFCGPSVGAGLE